MLEERWEPISNSLPKLFEDNAQKIKLEFASAVLSAQRAVPELSASTKEDQTGKEEVTMGTEGSESNVDTGIIWRASSFFRDFRGYILTFPEFVSTQSLRMDIVLEEFLWPRLFVAAEPLDYQVASVLLHALGFSEDTTMEHMTDKGEIFVCQRCISIVKRRLNWKDLVCPSVSFARYATGSLNH